MKNLIYLLLFCIALPLFCISFTSGGPVNHTGAPGDLTCVVCHGGTINSGSGSVTFSMDGDFTHYVPGQKYPITVRVTGSSINKYGFSISVRRNSDGVSTGKLIEGENQWQNGWTENQHITHSQLSTTGVWHMEWEAPATDEGDITFYVAANASERGQNSLINGYIYTTSTTITSINPNAVKKVDILETTLFPNPTISDFKVQFKLHTSGFVDIHVLDYTGRKVKSLLENHFYDAGVHQLNSELVGLAAATYYVQIKSDKETVLLPLLKK